MQEQDNQTPVVDSDGINSDIANSDTPVAETVATEVAATPEIKEVAVTEEVAETEATKAAVVDTPVLEKAPEPIVEPVAAEPEIERESMEFDVIIVGGGPAGLSQLVTTNLWFVWSKKAQSLVRIPYLALSSSRVL